MGNRAFVKQYGSSQGVYLHWNGGRDSVEAFLEYCKLKGSRGFDDDYGLAQFCQVVGNFFGCNLSIGVVNGIEMNESWDTDNGVYEVKGWDIVGRFPEDIEEQMEYDRYDMLCVIDDAQPESQRLGYDFFKSKEVKGEDIEENDTIYVHTVNEDWKKVKVVRKGSQLGYYTGVDWFHEIRKNEKYKK